MEDEKKDKIVLTNIHYSTPPPFPPLTSEFKSIKDWLVNMCDMEGFEEDMEMIHFRLVNPDSEKRYTLWFYCSHSANEYKVEEVYRFPYKNAIRNKKFDERIYYPLKDYEISNLNKEQVHNKIISELKLFTTTEKFKNSFFAKAKFVVVDFNGMVIWEQKSN